MEAKEQRRQMSPEEEGEEEEGENEASLSLPCGRQKGGLKITSNYITNQ